MQVVCFQGLTNVAFVSALLGQKNLATTLAEKAGIPVSLLQPVPDQLPSSSVDRREPSTEIL